MLSVLSDFGTLNISEYYGHSFFSLTKPDHFVLQETGIIIFGGKR